MKSTRSCRLSNHRPARLSAQFLAACTSPKVAQIFPPASVCKTLACSMVPNLEHSSKNSSLISCSHPASVSSSLSYMLWINKWRVSPLSRLPMNLDLAAVAAASWRATTSAAILALASATVGIAEAVAITGFTVVAVTAAVVVANPMALSNSCSAMVASADGSVLEAEEATAPAAAAADPMTIGAEVEVEVATLPPPVICAKTVKAFWARVAASSGYWSEVTTVHPAAMLDIDC
mmetsp:Transcript_12810/g.26979  ORF Transcript_12810/g.26979 Transcript_12810/m.26979 type:complete len:234 (-) Transcript_12810:1382-2083(-)